MSGTALLDGDLTDTIDIIYCVGPPIYADIGAVLGHTKLMLCFTDYLPSLSDPAGREKNKNVKYIDRSK